MRQLTVLFKGEKQVEYLLDLPDVIVGRGRSAHIRLDANPIVSRQHFVIREQRDAHVIEDLGGANGTFVGSDRIEVHTLRPGDRIIIGEHILRYGFSTREGVSLRDSVQFRKGEAQAPSKDDAAATMTMEPVGVVEEISFENIEEVDGYERIGALKRSPAPGPRLGSGGPANAADWADGPDHTRAASKEDLEEMLRVMTIKAKPHLEIVRGDQKDLFALNKPPIRIGHTDDCRIRLKGKRFFGLGNLAGTLVHQAGQWMIVPESPFWNPILMGGQKVEKIRALQAGGICEVRDLRFTFFKGEQR